MKKRKKQRIRQLIVMWLVFIVVVGGIVLSYLIKKDSAEDPAPVDTFQVYTEGRAFNGGTDFKTLMQESYVGYLNMAYILFGTYPECEYVKISANVERNDYNWSEDFYVGDGELYYNYYKDGVASGKVGIDVSEYQGSIDWTAVKSAGVDVAMVRVGYRGYGETGDIVADSYYSTNVSGALAAGLEVGVYFFTEAISAEEGVEEAKYVLSQVEGYDITYPIVIDTEYIYTDGGARANELSVETRTDAVVAFCETIRDAGYTPMVYANFDWFIRNLDIDRVGEFELWLAAYDTPRFPYHTEGYQYSKEGYVNGISTQVDLDVFMR